MIDFIRKIGDFTRETNEKKNERIHNKQFEQKQLQAVMRNLNYWSMPQF